MLISCDMSAKEYSKEEIKSKNIKYIEEIVFYSETIYIIVWEHPETKEQYIITNGAIERKKDKKEVDTGD